MLVARSPTKRAQPAAGPASPRLLPTSTVPCSPVKRHAADAAGSPLSKKGWAAVLGLVAAVVIIVVAVPVALKLSGGLGAGGFSGAVRLEAAPASAAAAAVLGGAPPPLRVHGARLVGPDGSEVELHGVNWFGFNNGKTMLDGLDMEPTASWEGGDFATIVQQLRLLGFNAVRLPFSFDNLFNLPPKSFTKVCPATMPSADALAARTVPPGMPRPSLASPAAPPLPPGSLPGACNSYLPSGPTTLARYAYVVQHFVSQGFYVLVDFHSHRAEQDEPALDSPAAFAAAWLRVWGALAALPAFDALRGRVFLDLLNEPDEHLLGWDGPLPGSSHTASLADYLLAAMDALHAAAPGATMFFLQGGGQPRLGTSWGDGFVTDRTIIAARRLSDPNAFFTQLRGKPYAGAVVLAPHLYGASVTSSPDVGATQWWKYSVSWGVLQQRGFCSPPGSTADCQRFPVVAGEIGTKFVSPLDQQYMADLVTWFRQLPPTNNATLYAGVSMGSWFWWAYNFNSFDTGGLVASDWQTLDWVKLKWLIANLGLKPWWKA